jgi:hypothetical protein
VHVNAFVVQPDIFIAYPINRAFVEGRTKHPPLLEYWLGSIVGLLVSLALLAVGLDIIPISFGENLEYIRWMILLTGVAALLSDLFVVSLGVGLRNGRLIEGRVVVADVRPVPSRPWQQMQYIRVEFTDPMGQRQVMLLRRAHRDGLALPQVGAQAAVLYASPMNRRLL